MKPSDKTDQREQIFPVFSLSTLSIIEIHWI